MAARGCEEGKLCFFDELLSLARDAGKGGAECAEVLRGVVQGCAELICERKELRLGRERG